MKPTTLLTESQLAERLQLSIHALRDDRRNLRKIPYIKINRAVRYDADAVDRALAAMTLGGPSQ